jgi:predicted alpha-1,6-mannanase (GH76 family)
MKRTARQVRLVARTALCAIAIAVPVATAPVVSAAQPNRPDWGARAQDSYSAMQSHLYLGSAGHHMYLEHYPKQTGDNDYSYFWPLREAAEATIHISRMRQTGYKGDVADRFTAVSHYWNASRGAYDSYPPPPYGSGGDPFYDDNAIIGLSAIKEYRFSGDKAKLADAERVFDFITTGWDTDPSLSCPGGLHWVAASWNSVRATNATSLAAELAVHLYEETGRSKYLDWGKRAYQWVRTCLRGPDGLYYNDIDFSGNINRTLWIYNSGSMIGAATLLYRVTRQSSYLDDAIRDASGALAYWTANDRYYDQPAIFNSIFFNNLLLLDSVRHDRGYRKAIEHYAALIWERNRDPRTGLFSFGASGGGPPTPDVRPQTLEQSATIQIFAVLVWNPRDYANAA